MFEISFILFPIAAYTCLLVLRSETVHLKVFYSPIWNNVATQTMCKGITVPFDHLHL